MEIHEINQWKFSVCSIKASKAEHPTTIHSHHVSSRQQASCQLSVIFLALLIIAAAYFVLSYFYSADLDNIEAVKEDKDRSNQVMTTMAIVGGVIALLAVTVAVFGGHDLQAVRELQMSSEDESGPHQLIVCTMSVLGRVSCEWHQNITLAKYANTHKVRFYNCCRRGRTDLCAFVKSESWENGFTFDCTDAEFNKWLNDPVSMFKEKGMES